MVTAHWWAQYGAILASAWEIPAKSIHKSYVLGERGEMVRESILQNSTGVVRWHQGHHENKHHDDVLLFFRLTVGLTFPQPCSRTAGLRKALPGLLDKSTVCTSSAGGMASRTVVCWFPDCEMQVALTGANGTRCRAGGGGVRPNWGSATLVLGFYIKRSSLGHTRLTWIFI